MDSPNTSIGNGTGVSPMSTNIYGSTNNTGSGGLYHNTNATMQQYVNLCEQLRDHATMDIVTNYTCIYLSPVVCLPSSILHTIIIIDIILFMWLLFLVCTLLVYIFCIFVCYVG